MGPGMGPVQKKIPGTKARAAGCYLLFAALALGQQPTAGTAIKVPQSLLIYLLFVTGPTCSIDGRD
jgi:hypothetical protein